MKWISLFILLLFPIYSTFRGLKAKRSTPKSRLKFYSRGILVCIFLLVLLFVLNPGFRAPLDFSSIGKGISINDSIITGLIVVFIMPFIHSFKRKNQLYPNDIANAKEIFGFPAQYFPDNHSEWCLFTLYIVVGVVFEELFCRMFMFHSMNRVLHLRGDLLLIISSMFFSIGHLYQGWKGILGSFAAGLVLGKIYMLTETIFYPIILHLFVNLTVVVLAFRRIKDLSKIKSLQS